MLLCKMVMEEASVKLFNHLNLWV